MDVLSHSLPLSDLMLRSEGFEKHEGRLPATILGPKLLHAPAVDVSLRDSGSFSVNNSLKDGSSLRETLDDTILFEDDPVDDLTTDDVLGVVERVGPVESMKRLLLREVLDNPREPNYNVSFDPLPESCRDSRHVGDLRWHEYYRMSELAETALPPMRYTRCDPSTGQRCFHRPSPVLQIFGMKLRTCTSDITNPVEVYGIIAVRDGEDYRRNYLFNRSRDNPLAINPISDHLRLMGPKRAMSLKYNCLLEVDIRVKTVGNSTEDITLVDGCLEFMEDEVSFQTLFKCTSDGPYGSATFDLIMFEFGVEATIQLNFLAVPSNGFDIQMYGYTSLQKNLYTFIDKNSECDSFVSSVGKLPQHFVAAVQVEDMLHIDFVEGGQPILFKAAIHGSQTKLYHFRNGAIVSVMVSWSTTFY